MKQFLIYGLIDPRCGGVRYIGRSTTGMRRPRQHRTPSNLKHDDYHNRWLRGLFAVGLDYQIVVFEFCYSIDVLLETEQKWIAAGRAAGWRLTNVTAGGLGALGWKPTPETRARMSAAAKGRPKSVAHREALAEANRGKIARPETRTKLSVALKAYVNRTPGAVERLRGLRKKTCADKPCERCGAMMTQGTRAPYAFAVVRFCSKVCGYAGRRNAWLTRRARATLHG